MAGFYGENVSKHVSQGSKTVLNGSWTALMAGSSIKPNRTHIRVFVRGGVGHAVGLAYANINADGSTFTTPTDDIRHVTVIPGGRTWVEPLSDKVQLYGRLDAKAAVTDTHIRVIVTEYS